MKNKPRKNEVPLKEFFYTEAEKHGVSSHMVAVRFYRGEYKGLKIRRVNKRVVYVDARAASCENFGEINPRPGEIPLKNWWAAQAEKLGVNWKCVAQRFYRGLLPLPPMRRVYRTLVYVQTGVPA